MLYSGIDIHKQVLKVAVHSPEIREPSEQHFRARFEWAACWQGRVDTVASKATATWRWLWRELQALGRELGLTKPARVRPRPGRGQWGTDWIDSWWLLLERHSS